MPYELGARLRLEVGIQRNPRENRRGTTGRSHGPLSGRTAAVDKIVVMQHGVRTTSRMTEAVEAITPSVGCGATSPATGAAGTVMIQETMAGGEGPRLVG